MCLSWVGFSVAGGTARLAMGFREFCAADRSHSLHWASRIFCFSPGNRLRGSCAFSTSSGFSLWRRGNSASRLTTVCGDRAHFRCCLACRCGAVGNSASHYLRRLACRCGPVEILLLAWQPSAEFCVSDRFGCGTVRILLFACLPQRIQPAS